jgi:beta-glucosidase
MVIDPGAAEARREVPGPGAKYRDPGTPLGQRVDDLIGRMTIEEKVAQLGCVWVTAMVKEGRFDPGAAASLLAHGIGQITRIGASTGLTPEKSAALMNLVQKVAVEQTRLGIPVIVHEESVGGYCARGATVFPQAVGLAATFDPDLVGEVATAIRAEMLAVGARQALAPVLDVARDPRWGRVEETYGEDPVLAGTLGAAYVKGLQTDDLRSGVVATGKHFLGYSMSQGGRNHGPVHLGPRELREVYAEPFAAAIREAGLASVMNSYSSIDGSPCAGSSAILTDLLRDELGFTGTVVADYRAVAQLFRYHRTAANKAEAAAQALTAGLDVELPASDCYGQPLLDAISTGMVPLATVDQSVRRVLEQKFRLGLFDHPYVDEAKAGGLFDSPAHRRLARRAAEESVVLLHNDGILPLVIGADDVVAIVGPGADNRRLLQGDYHYPAHQEIIDANFSRVTVDDEVVGGPLTGTGFREEAEGSSLLPEAGGAFEPGQVYTDHVTPLGALTAALGSPGQVLYEQGCSVSGEDRSGIPAAVSAAAKAKVVIVVVAGRSGLRESSTVGEGRDATDLRLTGVQEELVSQVVASATPVVVVVLSGRVHTLAQVLAGASALLQAFPPGEEGGAAIVDILLGRAQPSGRLPVSFPRSVGQVPVHASPRAGGTKAMYRGGYADSPATPLFPFGYGLSYTRFAYGELAVDATNTSEPVVATVAVTNVGPRPGTEVVQLYVSDRFASVARPGRQLAGFARVDLDPGQSRSVRFTVHPSRLAFFDPSMNFVTEPGAFGFAVGSSSADLPSQAVVELGGGVAHFRQREVVPTRAEVIS